MSYKYILGINILQKASGGPVSQWEQDCKSMLLVTYAAGMKSHLNTDNSNLGR
jgi:hypothetical protein